MKTFTDLIEEVQKPGLCHRYGGCVTFCTAINYGALKLDAEGKPRYADDDPLIPRLFSKRIKDNLFFTIIYEMTHTLCPADHGQSKILGDFQGQIGNTRARQQHRYSHLGGF